MGDTDAVDAALLRRLVPAVIGVLVRRGADFASAEDAVQEALIRALGTWPHDPARDPQGWLVATAWHRFLDAARAASSRRDREAAVDAVSTVGARAVEVDPAPAADDTLRLYFLCAHPDLPASAAVALTLRAVGGLTTRQIARAHLVPEATMAQRISRAKKRLEGASFDRAGDLATVLRVLYLVFNEGHGTGGDDEGGEGRGADLAEEAIRLTRQLAALSDEPEVAGLLALMLCHHARRASRTGPAGRLVPLAEQDRSRWDTAAVTEAVAVLQAALARDRLGEYQAQAAIAALHADAPSAAETDWVQVVEWYDELLALGENPVARLNRAVAVGEADGAPAGLAALAAVDPGVPRHAAVRAHLQERAGDLAASAGHYAEAARAATSVPERDHLTREAARVRRRLHTGAMAGSWQPGDSVPDRWLLALEAGTATLDETCEALAQHEWPDATPTGPGDTDPFPAGGWIRTVDAAYDDGRLTAEQYQALYDACGPRRKK